MISEFKLTKYGQCGVAIVELLDMNYDNLQSDFLKYVTIHILSYITKDGKASIVDSAVVSHTLAEDGESFNHIESRLNFDIDGQYEIKQILLPIDNTKDLYYNIETDEVIYGGKAISIEILSEINLDSLNIVYSTKNTFNICNLMQCFYNICKQLLSLLCPNGCIKNEYQDLIFRRDLVWMAINTIKYLLEKGQYLEAQRILDQIMGCNGVCKQELKTKKGFDCGCNR